MRQNKLLLLGFVVALALAALILYVPRDGKPLKPWNSSAITATYVGTQLRQLDSSNAALYLAYEVQNHTDFDYRLADGPEEVVMTQLGADGSLSSQERIGLSYPTFLPAHQRARVALQIQSPFLWPAENDPTYQDKFRDFVNQRLLDVHAFVLFDQLDRFEIEFPSGWQELKLASAVPR